MAIQENMYQITKFQNSKKLLEFNDKMSPANTEWGSNIHSNFSKIGIVIVDTSNGGGEKALVADCNVDPIKIKRLYEKVSKINHDAENKPASSNKSGSQASILSYGTYKGMTASEAVLKDGANAVKVLEGMLPILEKNSEKYPKNKNIIAEIKKAIELYNSGELKATESTESTNLGKNITLLYERKILPGEKNANEEGKQRVTELTIEYNPKMDSPFTVKISNGWGIAESTKTGGTKIGSGSCTMNKTANVVVGDEKFREMMLELKDFIKYREKQMIDEIRPKINEKRKSYNKEN